MGKPVSPRCSRSRPRFDRYRHGHIDSESGCDESLILNPPVIDMSGPATLKPLFVLPLNLDVTQARNFQAELSERLIFAPLNHVSTVAGLDACYRQDTAWGAAILTDAQGSRINSAVLGPIPCPFPYIPGFLTFREAPVISQALCRLECIPDCLILDGHGIFHPRYCGLASVLGLLFDVPSVGCAKSPLRATWVQPGPNRGDWTPVRMNGRLVGATVRTRDQVKPVWVSPGHRCDLESAVRLVLQLSRTRLPEPLRLADQAVSLAAAAKASV